MQIHGGLGSDKNVPEPREGRRGLPEVAANESANEPMEWGKLGYKWREGQDWLEQGAIRRLVQGFQDWSVRLEGRFGIVVQPDELVEQAELELSNMGAEKAAEVGEEISCYLWLLQWF